MYFADNSCFPYLGNRMEPSLNKGFIDTCFQKLLKLSESLRDPWWLSLKFLAHPWGDFFKSKEPRRDLSGDKPASVPTNFNQKRNESSFQQKVKREKQRRLSARVSNGTNYRFYRRKNRKQSLKEKKRWFPSPSASFFSTAPLSFYYFFTSNVF